MAGLRFDLGGRAPTFDTITSSAADLRSAAADVDLPDLTSGQGLGMQADLGLQSGGLLSGLSGAIQPVGDWLRSAFAGLETRPDPSPSGPDGGTPDPAPDPDPEDDAQTDTAPPQDSSAQPRVIEMAQAAAAAYDDRSDPFLDGTGADWQPVAAETLGLPEEGGPDAATPWVFKDGVFTAAPQIGGTDAGEVAVHIGEAVIDGETVLMVAFRGTDNPGNVAVDLADARTPTIKPVYSEALSPATDAVIDYVADEANGVDQVLVTGHSLGGVLAQVFMEDADPALGNFQAATFGSSGVNGASVTEDDRILHVEIAEDPVLDFIDRSEEVAEATPDGIVPLLFDPRVFSGERLVVGLDSTPSGDESGDPLFAHRMPAYEDSIASFVAENPDAVPAEFLFGASDSPESMAETATQEPQTDAPLSVTDLGVTTEDSGTALAAFKVALYAPKPDATQIAYTVTGASGAEDWVYAGATGTLDLAPGQTEATLEVEIGGAEAAATGEALLLTLQEAGQTVEHQLDLGRTAALDAAQEEAVQIDDLAAEDADPNPGSGPDQQARAPEPADAAPVSVPEWSLHTDMGSWLDQARDVVAQAASDACDAADLDLGQGRFVKWIDIAEERAEELEDRVEDLIDQI